MIGPFRQAVRMAGDYLRLYPLERGPAGEPYVDISPASVEKVLAYGGGLWLKARLPLDFLKPLLSSPPARPYRVLALRDYVHSSRGGGCTDPWHSPFCGSCGSRLRPRIIWVDPLARVARVGPAGFSGGWLVAAGMRFHPREVVAVYRSLEGLLYADVLTLRALPRPHPPGLLVEVEELPGTFIKPLRAPHVRRIAYEG